MAADRPSMIAVMEDVVVATPLLRAQTAEGKVRLVAAGAWTAPNAAELERLVAGFTSASTMARAASIDMRAIEQLDTYGALLLDRLSRRSQARVMSLAHKYNGLLDEVQGADIAAPAGAKRQNWMIEALESLGRSVSTKAEDLVALVSRPYWLNSAQALRDRLLYRVGFEGSVSGLQKGSAVLFNGVRVGEVTDNLHLDPVSPRQVHSIIAVDRGTPIRADTAVSIDFQGLTGSPVIALAGGASNRPLLAAGGEPPLLLPMPLPRGACHKRPARSCAGWTAFWPTTLRRCAT